MEAEHIVALGRHRDLEELIVAESRTDRLNGDAVPLHVDERRGLPVRAARTSWLGRSRYCTAYPGASRGASSA